MFDYSILHYSPSCSHANRHLTVNVYIRNIVNALQNAEHRSAHRIPYGALKPFWNDGLDDLKQKSIFLGMTFGKLWFPHPATYAIKCRSNLQYTC